MTFPSVGSIEVKVTMLLPGFKVTSTPFSAGDVSELDVPVTITSSSKAIPWTDTFLMFDPTSTLYVVVPR